MRTQPSSLKIGLLDNSYHSLKRGYEMWNEWKESDNPWLLKESVIWVHHGIELALKQLLVQTNEFLVFQDVNKAVEKLGSLRKKKGMEKAGVLDLFEHDDTVMSVGFKNLVDRTAITLSIPELAENADLRLKIDKLTKYRNKIVHFSIELDINIVANLLSEILEPLLFLLASEVKDENFKNVRIPEIRNIAQPVQKFSEKIRSDVVEKAIKSTLSALPPNGNRRAGIIGQAIGTGLQKSMISYLSQVRLLSGIRNNHVIVVVDREDIANNIYRHIADLESQDNKLNISFPRSKKALITNLEGEPKIILSTIQKLDMSLFLFEKECLVIGYDLHGMYEKIPKVFPNATYILFTISAISYPKQWHELFGNLVAKYAMKEAIDDRLLLPIKIENRKAILTIDKSDFTQPSLGGNSSTFFSSPSPFEITSIQQTSEFLKKIAQDIVYHFEKRQHNWKGKGIIVVSDVKTGFALYNEISIIRPIWYDENLNGGLVKVISSTNESSTERVNLIQKLKQQDDTLCLLIATGGFLQGFDNPLVHTIYVTSSISLQLRYRLASLVSRAYQGKESGVIVDYVGHNWNLEDT